MGHHSRSISTMALGLVVLHLLVASPSVVASPPPPELRQAVDLVEAGDFAAARSQFRAARVQDASGWGDYVEGRLLLEEEEVDASIESLLLAVEKSPEAARFRRWLGEAYIAKIDAVSVFKKRGIAKKALTELREAARIDPGDFGTRETLVGYYLNAPGIVGGGEDKAVAEAASFERLDPAGGQLLVAQIKMHNEDFEGAAEAYRAAALAKPEDARLRYRLGMALQSLERYDEAFSTFEKAIEIDPDYMDPYYQLGRTAVFSETNLERAAECMMVYLDNPAEPSSPGHEHAHWRLGMIYQLQGDSLVARREFEAALALDPGHDEAKKALRKLDRR